jgi:hypothetical protein
MDDRFFEAWITRSWKVCGLKLQPLCLGHVVNLEAIGSPLTPYRAIDPDAPITPADLLLAVRICSEKFPHPARLRPRLRDVFWRILLERSPRLFRLHALLFAAYRNDHCSSPEFWVDEESSGRAISAPIALSKAAFLLSNSTLSEGRIWSMPLGRVDYVIAAIEERKTGSVRFFYEEETAAIAPPMESVMTEEEIIEIARKDLAPAAFEAWLTARKAWREQKEAA